MMSDSQWLHDEQNDPLWEKILRSEGMGVGHRQRRKRINPNGKPQRWQEREVFSSEVVDAVTEGGVQSYVRNAPDSTVESLIGLRPHQEPPTSRQDLGELSDVLADALDQLTEVERQVFEVTAFSDAPMAEWADDLGLSLREFRSAKQTAQRKLRELLADDPAVVPHIERNEECL